MERIHAFAREHLKLGSERNKWYYDHKASHRGFEHGEPVWLHNPRCKTGRTPKLQRPWEGPYLVISRVDDLIYRIQKGPRSRPTVVHVDRLKKYQGHSLVNWLTEGKTGKDRVSTAGEASRSGQPTKQQNIKPTPAAREFEKVPAIAKKAKERPCRTPRRPAWTVDYQMD